jgi:hypothetical protein
MRTAHWNIVAGLIVGMGLATPRACAADGGPANPGPAAVEAKLAELNTLARAHYAAAKAATLAGISPIIVVEPDALTLIRNGVTKREVYLPARYADLKALSHMTMGLYSLLQPHADKHDFPAWRADLQAYRARVAEIQPLIGDLGLHWDDARRVRALAASTLAFMDRVLANGAVSRADLHAYADDVGPSLLGNLYDASDAELKSLAALVSRWRGEMSAAEWARLYVVVLGVARPRERLPPYDYFARLLGPRAIGTRLIHADNVTDVAGALDLLATTVNDRKMAADFFRDPHRIDHGLMRESTERHLEQMFGKSATK